MRFIKWTEQTFTSGGRETEVLPPRALHPRASRGARYRDDVRYLRIWVKYADCCKEPHDIFKFLQVNDVGQRHTLFYEAYAAFLEIRGAFKQAGEVYDRGILMRAEPTQRLKEKLAQFQHRMMKRKQRKMEEGGALEEEGEGETRRFGEVGAAARGGSANAENPGSAVRSGGGGAAGVVDRGPAASVARAVSVAVARPRVPTRTTAVWRFTATTRTGRLHPRLLRHGRTSASTLRPAKKTRGEPRSGRVRASGTNDRGPDRLAPSLPPQPSRFTRMRTSRRLRLRLRRTRL